MITSGEGIFEGVGGTVLRWQTWTPEEPRARVLLVHGWGEHSGRYAFVAGALAGRGFAVFTYDQRGHGRSQGPRGHADAFDDLVEDLRYAIRESRVRIPGELPEAIVAHSLGGLVALRYLHAPDAQRPAAVVLSAPWLQTKLPVAGWLVRVAEVLDQIWPSAPVSRRIDPALRTRDPAMIEACRSDRLLHGRLTPRLFLEVARIQGQVRSQAHGFDSLILFLVPGGDQLVDPTVTEHYARSLGDGAEVLELPGLRHEPFNEVEREEVLAKVGDWLERRLFRTGLGDAGSSPPASERPTG